MEAWLVRMERNIVESLDVVNDSLISSFRRILRHKVDQDWQELFIGNQQFRFLSHSMRSEVDSKLNTAYLQHYLDLGCMSYSF